MQLPPKLLFEFFERRQCIIFAGFDLYRRDIMPAADFALGNEEINFHT